MVNGRGAWNKNGMPPNGTAYYQLLTPEEVGSTPTKGQAYLAVNYGVKAIQERINELGYTPHLVVDGWFGALTNSGLIWAQKKVGVGADGQCGPHTATAFFWPIIKARATFTTINLSQVVGGIINHESAFDPGAVGYVDYNDIGLAQINLPSNQTITMADAFEYHLAIQYVATRMKNAYAAFSNHDAAIVSYNSPLWAQQWQATGKAPTTAAQAYVDAVKAWVPPTS